MIYENLIIKENMVREIITWLNNIERINNVENYNYSIIFTLIASPYYAKYRK